MRSEGKLNEVGRKREGPALYKHIFLLGQLFSLASFTVVQQIKLKC
jgi:hypothetical protein